jgi:hypothetical protein
MRGNTMKGTAISAAVVAALTLVGVTAHASCVDPRAGHQRGTIQTQAPQMLGSSGAENSNAARTIVGTWLVTYTGDDGSPGGQAFIQWHSDGTEWENINFPPVVGNICMGSWKQLDKTHVFRNHYGWLFNDDGSLFGYFNETETAELSRDGNGYHGHTVMTIFDASGNNLGSNSGSSLATRISP